MFGTENNAHFRRRFAEWRGKHVAIERIYLDTALLIKEFVDQNNLEAIQQQLINAESDLYTYFGQYNGRTFGSIIYALFEIEGYLQHTENKDERKLLGAIITNLKNGYEHPRQEPKKNFAELMARLNQWLDKFVLNVTNPTPVAATCLSLYVLLKINYISVSHLSYPKKKLASLFSISISESKTTIEGILLKLEAKIKTLEQQKTESARQEQLATPLTIANYFDAKFIELFEKKDLSVSEKIDQIKTLLDNIYTDTPKLVAAKAEEEKVSTQIKHAETLLLAIDNNDKKITGRQYALELIDSHFESYKNLIDHAENFEREAWNQRLKQLSEPNLTQKIKKVGLVAASWLSAITTIPYRALVPENIQQTINEIVPSTFDSESKAKLKLLTETRLITLNSELETSKNKIETFINSLMGEQDQAVKQLMAKTSPIEFNNMLETNRMIFKLISNYEQLQRQVMDNHQKLNVAKKLEHTVTAFLAKHYGFLVKLSLFLSKICSLFKTDSASKVETVIAIQAKLSLLKKQYQQEFFLDMQQLTTNPNIPQAIKTTLVQQLNTNPKNPKPHHHAAEHRPKTLRASFFFIQLKYQTLVDKPHTIKPAISK